jgi:imidazolonepropionase-like amidohydrolase
MADQYRKTCHEGYLADLLLVDGDPIQNVRILEDKDKLLGIMKDGKFYKEPVENRYQQSRIA